MGIANGRCADCGKEMDGVLTTAWKPGEVTDFLCSWREACKRAPIAITITITRALCVECRGGYLHKVNAFDVSRGPALISLKGEDDVGHTGAS